MGKKFVPVFDAVVEVHGHHPPIAGGPHSRDRPIARNILSPRGAHYLGPQIVKVGTADRRAIRPLGWRGDGIAHTHRNAFGGFDLLGRFQDIRVHLGAVERRGQH